MRARSGRPWCWTHDPECAQGRAAARQLGGRRRKRGTGDGAPEDVRLRDVASIQQLVERATREALALDAGLEWCRVLLQAADRAARLLEVGSHEDRLAALEARLAAVPSMPGPRRAG
jgi:hypothetical protein